MYKKIMLKMKLGRHKNDSQKNEANRVYVPPIKFLAGFFAA